MTIFFSSANMGFYDDTMKEDYNLAGTWPADANPVSDRYYEYLQKGLSGGKTIAKNEYNQPILVDPPAPTKEMLIAEAAARKSSLMTESTKAIDTLKDAVELGKATKEEEALLLAWREYRILLMRVDTSLAPDINWPDLVE